MFIDLTVTIDRTRISETQPLSKLGHLGTHFDVMDKTFPLEYIRSVGRLIDISHLRDREVVPGDIGVPIARDEFIIFRTDYAIDIGYGGRDYNFKSAELSDEVVTHLLDKGVRLIGVDAASIQKPAKHLQVDRRCAEHNVFVVENLCNLDALANAVVEQAFTVYCAPLNVVGLTGLPCRVVADTKDAGGGEQSST
jgi:kynurenine formamidase